MPWQKSAPSTCRGKRLSAARWWRCLPIVTAGLLAACATPSTPPSLAVQCPEPKPSVVVRLACPAELEPLPDDTMGSLANALMAAAETYHACRRAALAQ